VLGVHASYDMIKKYKGFVFECIWCVQMNCWLPQRLLLGRPLRRMNSVVRHAIQLYNNYSYMSSWPPSTKLQEEGRDITITTDADTLVETFAKAIPSSKHYLHAVVGTTSHTQQSPHPSRAHPHPSRAYSFEALFALVSALVAEGKVERWVDPNTDLHVYSYLIGTNRDPRDEPEPDVDMCRGLVLHPSTCSIVATPFAKFTCVGDLPMAATTAPATARARASIKYDGSLLIAFLWGGQVYATTRRRMDSEQAICGTQLLRSSEAVAAEMKMGWTYMFELIGGDNSHIVNYPGHRVILLSVYDALGMEVEPVERENIALRMEVQVAPCVYGTFAELARLVSGPESLMYRWPHSDYRYKVALHPPFGHIAAEDNGELYPLFNEGWVIEILDSGLRFKSIDHGWDLGCHAVKDLVHPVAVWSFSLNDSLRNLLTNPHLPRHALMEIRKIADSLMTTFEAPLFELSLSPTQKCLMEEYRPSRENTQWRGVDTKMLQSLTIAEDREPSGRVSDIDNVTAATKKRRGAADSVDEEVNKRARARLRKRCRICGCTAELDEVGDQICFCDTCRGSGNSCTLVWSDIHPCGVDFPLGEKQLQYQSARSKFVGCDICGCLRELDDCGDRICFCDSCFGCDKPCCYSKNTSIDGTAVTSFCASKPCVRCGCDTERRYGRNCSCLSCAKSGCWSVSLGPASDEAIDLTVFTQLRMGMNMDSSTFMMAVPSPQTRPLCDVDPFSNKHTLTSACEWCGCQSEWDDEGNRVCFCDTCFGSNKSCHLIDVSKLVCGNALVSRSLYLAVNKSDLCAFVKALGDAEFCKVSIDVLKLCETYEAIAFFSMSRRCLTKKSLLIRYLLLHNCRPSPRGELSQYTPSQWLAQTFAKGWTHPSHLRRAAASLAWDVNTDAALNTFFASGDASTLVFSFLTSERMQCYGGYGMRARYELPELRLVCRLWNQIITNCFQDDLTKWRLQQNAIGLAKRLHRDDYDSDFPGYGS
jgi:hypothetical protein